MKFLGGMDLGCVSSDSWQAGMEGWLLEAFGGTELGMAIDSAMEVGIMSLVKVFNMVRFRCYAWTGRGRSEDTQEMGFGFFLLRPGIIYNVAPAVNG